MNTSCESILKRSRAIDLSIFQAAIESTSPVCARRTRTRAQRIRSLLRRHPHHVDTILLYVDFLEDMADYDEAVQVLQKKLRYAEDPGSSTAFNNSLGSRGSASERTMWRPRFENLDVPSARRARSDSNLQTVGLENPQALSNAHQGLPFAALRKSHLRRNRRSHHLDARTATVG